MRSRAVMIASLAMALGAAMPEVAPVRDSPPRPSGPRPSKNHHAGGGNPAGEYNRDRESARRRRQMERAALKKAQRGFIDFGPAFLICFIAGVLVGLALPWIFRLLRLVVTLMAGAMA